MFSRASFRNRHFRHSACTYHGGGHVLELCKMECRGQGSTSMFPLRPCRRYQSLRKPPSSIRRVCSAFSDEQRQWCIHNIDLVGKHRPMNTYVSQQLSDNIIGNWKLWEVLLHQNFFDVVGIRAREKRSSIHVRTHCNIKHASEAKRQHWQEKLPYDVQFSSPIHLH